MACKMYWIYMSKRPHEAGCLVMLSLMVKCRKFIASYPLPVATGWLKKMGNMAQYSNRQRKRIQNPCSVGSNPTWATKSRCLYHSFGLYKVEDSGVRWFSQKASNIWKQRFMSQCFLHLFNVDYRAISRVSNVTLCWQRSKSCNQSPNSRLGG